MRRTRRPDNCPASTSTSPRVIDPSPYSAHTDACCTLTGQTRPRQPSSARRPSTASRKSPLYRCIIESSRFPPVCPPRRACSSVGSRARSTRRASRALRASASAHLRMPPGGSTPSSSRSCPELPPLSNIVTTALTSSHGLDLRPPSRLGRPVPPPKQPMFNSRRRIGTIVVHAPHTTARGSSETQQTRPTRANYNIGMMQIPAAVRTLERDLREMFRSRLESFVVYGLHAHDAADAHDAAHAHGKERPLTHTIAILDALSSDDLRACAAHAAKWHEMALATPLLLA